MNVRREERELNTASRFVIAFCVCAAWALVSIHSAVAISPLTSAQIHFRANAAFKHLLPALRRTGVPLLLPATLPIPHAYADLGAARPRRYIINLGYVPRCGGHACELGHLAAHAIPSPFHAPLGHRVKVAQRVSGYFVNFTCGANCGDAFLRLDFRGYRYTFALKAGGKQELLTPARSALTVGPS